LPELLGKRNDDALRAADVTEPIHVLILGDFTYELSAIGAQAREDVLTVIQFSMEELTGGNRGAIKRFDPLEGARAKALPHTSQNALMELER